jgi:Protein of unknown function (DUF3306)
MKNNETFAARWARRKLEAQRSKSAEARDPDAAAKPIESQPPDDSTPLPSLDDITPEGDIAAFLQKRVPAELQRLALRKAWTTDPAISSFIEVAENQYDWNAIDGVPGFGPMDPSWDIDALLAQATGALPPAKDDIAVATSTTSVEEVAGTHHRDILTHHKDPQAAEASMSHETECDALHNAPEYEHPLGPPQALATAERPLLGLTNSNIDEGSLGDMPEDSQRLALHHPQLARRSRHGGALPE